MVVSTTGIGATRKTLGEDVATLISYLIAGAMTATCVTLLFMKFLEILPNGIWALVVLCSLTSVCVIIHACLERVVSLPSLYSTANPLVRMNRRRALKRNGGRTPDDNPDKMDKMDKMGGVAGQSA